MTKKRRPQGDGSVFWSESKKCWIGRAIVGVKPNGKPRYKEVSAKTQGLALQKKKKAEEEGKSGVLPVSGEIVTLGQWADHWIKNICQPNVQPTTWASHERCVRVHIVPRLGGIKLNQIHRTHIEQFVADLRRDGASGGNTKKIFDVLNTCLNKAVDSEYLRTNPAAKVSKPQSESDPIMPFTPDEIMRIRLALFDHRHESLFAVAIASGARQGEIFGLGWQHIDFDDGTIHIQRSLSYTKHKGFVLKAPKSERGNRVIDLPKFAMDALAEHRKKMLADGRDVRTGMVFLSATGTYLEKGNFIRKVYVKLLKKADVPYRKFHTFRHTHASELLHRGENVVDVARRIGDRQEVVLKTYAKFIPGNGGRIAKRLEDMYG